MASPRNLLRSVWNAFKGRDPTQATAEGYSYTISSGSYTRPDRARRRIQNERSLINMIINRIAVDSAQVDVKHVRVDEDDNYVETLKDELNYILTKEANLDQTGRDFILDAIQSMLDEGYVALAPIETNVNPEDGSFKVITARVGKILQWYPTMVLVETYNELTGKRDQLMCSKYTTPILENPFYSIMNEPNSTLQRLIRTLNQLDRFNDTISSGKMDLIVQFPYGAKSVAMQRMAKQRLSDIEDQLVDSKYGIAYIDGTEKVIQLNRPVENNLWNQAKELEERLFNQLGLTMAVFNGTADESTMNNYYAHEIEPILCELIEQIERKWLSKKARTQGQAIRFFRDPFKLMPVSMIAETADKLTRNEVMTSNEVRRKIGLKPSNDPRADELRNSNLNHPDEGEQKQQSSTEDSENFKIK